MLINAPAVGVSVLYFLIFDVVSLYLLLQYRRKFYSRGLLIGLFTFIVGQGFSFLNPQLGISSFGLLVSGYRHYYHELFNHTNGTH